MNVIKLPFLPPRRSFSELKAVRNCKCGASGGGGKNIYLGPDSFSLAGAAVVVINHARAAASARNVKRVKTGNRSAITVEIWLIFMATRSGSGPELTPRFLTFD